MKPHLIAFLTFGCSAAGFGQGTIHFTNFDPSVGLDAPVFGADCVTRLSGPQWQVTLVAGVLPADLAPVATTSFLAGQSAGYFDGGIVTLTNTPPYVFTFAQIEYWNTNASAMGQSWIFNVWTGNGDSNAGPLVGLKSGVPLDPPPPKLAMLVTSTNTVVLSWDTFYSQLYFLQQSPDLNSTDWTRVTSVPKPISCSRSQVILPAPSNLMFYRLAGF